MTFSKAQRLTSASSPNIGDYNGLDIVVNRAISVFTDNRFEGAGVSDSIDIYAAAPTMPALEFFLADAGAEPLPPFVQRASPGHWAWPFRRPA